MNMTSRMVQTLRLLTLSLLVGTFVVSCNKDDDNDTPSSDVVQVATADAELSTFVKAVQKAELTSTLNGAGPFTVFAPTNAAFTASGINVDSVSKDDLKEILLRHVLNSKKLAADLDSGTVSTANNKTLAVSVSGGSVYVNGTVKVTTADVQASNGVIHKIDRVITLPTKSITALLAANTDYSTLTELLDETGLKDTLSTGAFTLLAPSNTAFEAYYATINPDTLTAAQKRSILLQHTVPGVFYTSSFKAGSLNSAWSGHPLTVGVDGTNISFKTATDSTGAKIVSASSNWAATNGVVHGVDKVLK